MGMRFGVGLPGPFFVFAGDDGRSQESKASREYDRAMKYAMKVVRSDAYLADIEVARDEMLAYGYGAAAERLVDECLRHFGQHSAGVTSSLAQGERRRTPPATRVNCRLRAAWLVLPVYSWVRLVQS